MHQGSQASQAERSKHDFPIKFCQEYFGIPHELISVMSSDLGLEILYSLWRDIGYQMYESRLYTLRSECYRTFNEFAKRQVMPQFFDLIPEDGIILDYGCGSAELARASWYDLGRKALLYETSQITLKYLDQKYQDFLNISISGQLAYICQSSPFDGVICTDVLEHTDDPIGVTEFIYDILKPGGHALIFFSTAHPHPGHIKKSIDQYSEWIFRVGGLFDLIMTNNEDTLLLRKK